MPFAVVVARVSNLFHSALPPPDASSSSSGGGGGGGGANASWLLAALNDQRELELLCGVVFSPPDAALLAHGAGTGGLGGLGGLASLAALGGGGGSDA
jgi:hypothetical protein